MHPPLSFAILWLLLPALLRGAPPTVVSVSPVPQHLPAAARTAIVVNFDVPIDTSSVTRRSFHVLGHWSGVVEGSFRFEAGNTRVTFFPSRDLSAGEMVLCNVARTVPSAGGDTMLRGYAWTFWVRTIPGSMQLTET